MLSEKCLCVCDGTPTVKPGDALREVFVCVCVCVCVCAWWDSCCKLGVFLSLKCFSSSLLSYSLLSSPLLLSFPLLFSSLLFSSPLTSSSSPPLLFSPPLPPLLHSRFS